LIILQFVQKISTAGLALVLVVKLNMLFNDNLKDFALQCNVSVQMYNNCQCCWWRNKTQGIYMWFLLYNSHHFFFRVWFNLKKRKWF